MQEEKVRLRRKTDDEVAKLMVKVNGDRRKLTRKSRKQKFAHVLGKNAQYSDIRELNEFK